MSSRKTIAAGRKDCAFTISLSKEMPSFCQSHLMTQFGIQKMKKKGTDHELSDIFMAFFPFSAKKSSPKTVTPKRFLWWMTSQKPEVMTKIRMI